MEDTPEIAEPESSTARGLSAAATVAKDPPAPPAEGDELSPAETRVAEDATNWLLESFDGAIPAETKTLQLNVGTSVAPHWIAWTIRAVEGQVLRTIRARAAEAATRSKGGAQDTADAAFRANMRVVVEGTVDPDLTEIAKRRGLAHGELVVEDAFKSKQGLIDQIAGEIMSLSGYDDDDVRDAIEIGAAGNS